MTTVVFVHGMYMTGASWAPWQETFEAAGYETVAPSWPGREGEPAALRESPDPGLRTLTLEEVVDQYAALVRGLPEPPILVGHSMGGLVVELLLDRGLGRAGVALDAAPPKGVSSNRWSFVKCALPFLAPTSRPLPVRPHHFRYAFANTLDREASLAIRDAYAVPESRKVGRGPTKKSAKVDFDHARALLVAGGEDHIIPASLVRKVYRHQQDGGSPTELLTFEDRAHWTIVGEPGGGEVAAAVLAWVQRQAPPR